MRLITLSVSTVIFQRIEIIAKLPYLSSAIICLDKNLVLLTVKKDFSMSALAAVTGIIANTIKKCLFI